jgi:Ca-activated chloride channel family protein
MEFLALRFAEPLWFLLIPLLALPFWQEWHRPRLAWPESSKICLLPRGFGGSLRWLPVFARTATAALLIAALARPQSLAGTIRLHARGVAIVITLDTSRTMSTADYATPDGPISRLSAAKQTIQHFVNGRPDDLIGLIAFADYPDTVCPPTLDHAFLLDALSALPQAPAHEPGTNLGDALAWAVRDAREASPPRKVIILLTDGRNEPGVEQPLDPIEAARIAARLGASVHIISLAPATDEELDVLLLRMARAAGGTLHQAADESQLKTTLDQISQIETSPIDSTERTRFQELFPAFLLGSLGCISLEGLLRFGRWRRLP